MGMLFAASFFNNNNEKGQISYSDLAPVPNIKYESEGLENEVIAIKEMLAEVLRLKSYGFLCHTSKHFVDIVSGMMETGDIYQWTCSHQDPSWVTVDCDGSVYPCDDYKGNNMDFDMTTLVDRWDDFVDETCLSVMNQDCRCCWNTHIDAHGIMKGEFNVNDYVHGRN